MLALSPFLLACMLFSAVSFLFFGYSCLTSLFMRQEFERYGLAKYRRLTGTLQIIGALCLLGGLFYLPLAITGAAGLMVLMLLGLAVRIRLRDSFIQSTPALFYALLNLVIVLILLETSP
jgi:hypothetical protein